MMQRHVRQTTPTRGCGLVRTILGIAAVAIVLAYRSDSVWADTNNWLGTSGSWFTSANWSSGVLPSSSDDAFIANTNIASAIVQGTTTATTGNLFINNGGVMVGNISAGALTVDGEISVGTLGTSGALTLNIGTISANTISVGANGTYSDNSSGVIVLTGSNPTIQMAGGVNVVINGTISGTAGLIKNGLGTLTFAGNNTYSGGTTISLGTLRVGNGGTSGSLGSGDVTDNGALVFNRSDGMAVDDAIAGTGSLTQTGGGTLTLTGNNTYSGGTTINAGTLQVGNGGTTGSLGTGAVTDNSALVFDRSDDITVSNAISGAGSMQQAGIGTLVLAGTNNYSGRTTISSGTLQIGNGGTTGSLGTGTVSNNAMLVFDRSDTLTISNAINGTGSLTQNGSGTLILVASNTYTGRTVISAGTLQVGDGNAVGSLGSGDVTNGSVLVFDRSDSILVSNKISGVGSLNQAGTGSLTLTNANTYSGGSWVSDGGTLTVLDGQALGRGGLNLINGTFALGTGIVAYVGGSYTQAANGTLQIAIGATNLYGQLNIAGTASLAGTVQVVRIGSYVPQHNDTFTFLIASNGITGTFSTFTNNFAYSTLLSPNLTYEANDVTLKWTQLSFTPYALTKNQLAIARNMDVVSSSTISSAVALVDFLDNVTDPSNNLPVAFNEISPEQLTAMFTMAFAGMEAQGSRFLQRANELRANYPDLYLNAYDHEVANGKMTSPSPDDNSAGESPRERITRLVDNPWSVYAEGGGKFATVPGNTNAAGYGLASGDFTIGADRLMGHQLFVGGMLGYNGGEASLSGNGHIDMDSYLAQLYAAWFRQGLHVEGMLGGGINSYRTMRDGLQGDASGSADGFEYNTLVSGGYDWQAGEWSFGPQLVVQYMSASIDAFDEKGSLAPLHIESQSVDSLSTQFGADLRYRHYVEPTLTFLTPELYIGWQHQYLDTSIPLKSRLASGAGDVFTVYGPDLGSDSIVMSLGITVQWKPTISTYLHYTMQSAIQSKGYEANAIDAGTRISF